jgi:hypothetical protein
MKSFRESFVSLTRRNKTQFENSTGRTNNDLKTINATENSNFVNYPGEPASGARPELLGTHELIINQICFEHWQDRVS